MKLEFNTIFKGELNVKKILLAITLALTITAAGTVISMAEEKAVEQPTATPFITSDPSGGGI